jgi:P-type E1-E2 ATPase
MIEVAIPGQAALRLTCALFDLNGTLTVDGRIDPPVAEALRELSGRLRCAILSADTFGTLAAVAASLGLEGVVVRDGAEKAARVAAVQAEGGRVAAVGNGRNDLPMLRAADLAIAVLGPEGSAAAALTAAQVVCRSGLEAVELLLRPDRLVATLRP